MKNIRVAPADFQAGIGMKEAQSIRCVSKPKTSVSQVHPKVVVVDIVAQMLQATHAVGTNKEFVNDDASTPSDSGSRCEISDAIRSEWRVARSSDAGM